MSRLPLRRHLHKVAAVVAPVLLTIGCSSTGATTDDQGVTHITVASQTNTTGFTPWLAKELGYFQDAKLEVKLQYANNGAALLASGAAGDWQAGWIGAPPLLTGYANWGLIPTGTMLTENKNIILFMDRDVLKGVSPAEALAKTPVGVVSNSVSAQLLYACAEELGVKAADVETVPLDPAAIVNGMLNNDVNAAVTFSPVNWPLVQDKDKYVQVCNGDDAGVTLADPYMVTPAFWKQKPEVASAYVAAVYRANEYILEHPMKDVLPYLMDYLDSIGVDVSKEAAEYSLSVRNYVTLDEALQQMRSGEFADSLGTTAEFLVEAGVYDTVPDVEAMSKEGLEILEAAAALRG